MMRRQLKWAAVNVLLWAQGVLIPITRWCNHTVTRLLIDLELSMYPQDR